MRRIIGKIERGYNTPTHKATMEYVIGVDGGELKSSDFRNYITAFQTFTNCLMLNAIFEKGKITIVYRPRRFWNCKESAKKRITT